MAAPSRASAVVNRVLNWRNVVAMVHDLLATAAAWVGAYLLRLNFELYDPYSDAVWRDLAWIVPLQGVIFWRLRMYRGLWRYASLPDLRRILIAVALGAAAIALVIVLFRVPDVPRSVIVLYPILLAVFMGGTRVAYRAWREGHLTRLSSAAAKPVVILGAGAAAAGLLKGIGRNPDWHFVGLLDDDPTKLRREIQGLRVLGPLDALPAIAAEHGVELAIIAMPGATHGGRRRALELCTQVGVAALTVPSYEDLVSGKVTVSQLRPIELDDLLGRDPVALDTEGLADWLRGRTVLVTGAGGSIGAELTRQILRFGPACLVALEASELALYTLEQELEGKHPATRMAYVIGDVKSRRRLEDVFATYRPTTVFHAAAYKHVPLMEEANAWEAVQNNALGTWRVAQAALAHGVEKFVLVSTDKAVNPTNVMGASKRLAEMLCRGLSDGSTRFVAVRFGNVLGSTGSVIPKFHKQIADGGPITVTHPEIREIFVLDMGEPVRIVDLARDLIRLSGLTEEDIKIAFTGLRPGEKLYEELLANDETTAPTPHPKLRVMKADTKPAQAFLDDAVAWLERDAVVVDTEVRAGLAVRIPEYRPAGENTVAPCSANSISAH